MEVKTGSFGAADVRGLAEFVRRFPKYRPLVVCDPAQVAIAERLAIPAVSWPQFLWSGPAAA